MPIKTRRAKENASVIIDHEKCNLCGLCLKVCKGAPLYMGDGRIETDYSQGFGCIGCAQCAAVCPQECIVVEGRSLSAQDLLQLPAKESRASYKQLHNLMLARRSVRNFKQQEVELELIERIIETVSTAPMGIPPSEVEILVLSGFKQVNEFSRDMVEVFQKQKWVFSPPVLAIMRPFIGKDGYEMMKTFAAPLPDFFAETTAKGEDWLLYGAPLALYFHCSPTSDPADPLVAASYAMLTAESLGLGSCMIGSIAPFLKHRSKINDKYGIPAKNTQGIMVILGYPAVKYHRAVKRSLARVNYYQGRTCK